MAFEDESNLFCPTIRRHFFCNWKGHFTDLQGHLLKDHKTMFLKNNVLILNKSNFSLMNRGFLITDESKQIYYLSVCYHFDRMLYLHVMSLNDRLERRKYRVKMNEESFEGVVGGVEYVRVAVCDFFVDVQELHFEIIME